MTGFELLGAWVSIALTLMLLSFLYDDNPIYKLAEHLFLGISIGVGITEQYFGVLKVHMVDKFAEMFAGDWVNVIYVIPLILVLLLFAKLDKKRSYLARIPISILVAAYAGVKLTGEADANLMQQVASSTPDLRESWAANLAAGTETKWSTYQMGQGWVESTVVGSCTDGASWFNGLWCMSNDGAGVISSILLVIGLVCSLIYFYFGKHDRASLRAAGRIGVWTLMLGFGASFGYTVMGRISLAIGRAEELLGVGLTAEQYTEVKPWLVTPLMALMVIAGLVVWRRSGGGRPTPKATDEHDGP